MCASACINVYSYKCIVNLFFRVADQVVEVALSKCTPQHHENQGCCVMRIPQICLSNILHPQVGTLFSRETNNNNPILSPSSHSHSWCSHVCVFVYLDEDVVVLHQQRVVVDLPQELRRHHLVWAVLDEACHIEVTCGNRESWQIKLARNVLPIIPWHRGDFT